MDPKNMADDEFNKHLYKLNIIETVIGHMICDEVSNYLIDDLCDKYHKKFDYIDVSIFNSLFQDTIKYAFHETIFDDNYSNNDELSNLLIQNIDWDKENSYQDFFGGNVKWNEEVEKAYVNWKNTNITKMKPVIEKYLDENLADLVALYSKKSK